MLSHFKRPLRDGSWVVSSFGESGSVPMVTRGANPTRTPTPTFGPLTPAQAVPWVEKYHPVDEDQLATHKKKYQDVRSWFEEQVRQHLATIGTDRTGNNRTALLLTGPTGAGKTATVRLLAKQFGYDVREWIHRPGVVAHYCQGHQQFDESQAITFRDFLLRTGKYSDQIFVGDHHKRKLILIEDFPSAFGSRMEELHNILRAYFKVSSCPTVFIVTDSASSASNERALFPAHFLLEINVTHIAFNPVSPTNMVRALKTIVETENLDVSKDMLELLADSSQGDIRSAINALQFTCDVGAAMNASKAKKAKVTVPRSRIRRGQRNNPSATPVIAVAARDDSLFLFHVLGKILHCKRDFNHAACEASSSSSLPCKGERFPLLVKPEEVWEKSSASASTFGAFLHQNYLSFFGDIEDVGHVSEYLSLSDVFLGDWASVEVLHLYAVSISTRGIMYFRNEKMSGGFRPLHKPKFFSIQQSCKVNSEKARNLFAATQFSLSRADLFSEIIPFSRKYLSCALTLEQNSFIGNNFQPFTGRTVAKKQQFELLNESEVEFSTAGEEVNDDDDDKDRRFRAIENADQLMKRLSESCHEDDDYIIEEFDD